MNTVMHVGLPDGEQRHPVVLLHRHCNPLVSISFLMPTALPIPRECRLIPTKCVPVYQTLMVTVSLMLERTHAKATLVAHSFVTLAAKQLLMESFHGVLDAPVKDNQASTVKLLTI